MMTLAGLRQGTPQSSLQVADARPGFEIRLANQVLDAKSFKASFAGQTSGGSVAEFSASQGSPRRREPWGGLEAQGAPVEIDIGYGDELVPFFRGTVEQEGLAYGAFKLMAEQRLMEQVDYGGYYIDEVLYDLFYRAGRTAGRGTLEVRGGRSYLVRDAVYTLETTLLEVAESIAESASFVLLDRPGAGFGSQLAMPKPRPGAYGKASATYTPAHYTPRAFEPKLARGGFYASVLVFNRNEDGSYAAFARAPVNNSVAGGYKPPPNRVYVVPEFTGGDAEAEQVAYDTARSLERGIYTADLTVAANPELSPYDAIRVEHLEYRGDERYEVVYLCQIDRGLSCTGSVKGLDMQLGLSAIKETERLLPARAFFSLSTSRVAQLPWGVDPGGLYLNDAHPITEQFVGEDQMGVWVDFERMPGGYEHYVGEDGNGYWIEVE